MKQVLTFPSIPSERQEIWREQMKKGQGGEGIISSLRKKASHPFILRWVKSDALWRKETKTISKTKIFLELHLLKINKNRIRAITFTWEVTGYVQKLMRDRKALEKEEGGELKGGSPQPSCDPRVKILEPHTKNNPRAWSEDLTEMQYRQHKASHKDPLPRFPKKCQHTGKTVARNMEFAQAENEDPISVY